MRQGCSLSPPLFNLYSEETINEIKHETENIGVKVYGKTIKMFGFTDDIVFLANTQKERETIKPVPGLLTITTTTRNFEEIREEFKDIKRSQNIYKIFRSDYKYNWKIQNLSARNEK